MNACGIVLEPGLARSGGLIQDQADMELELCKVEEKTGKGKTRCNLTRPDKKLNCNPLIFCFFY